MAYPMRRKVANQVAIQLIEADVDIGFALLDEARTFRAYGQPALCAHVLGEAADIVADIQRRLQELECSEAGAFRSLVVELQNAIAQAQREAS